MNINPHRVHRYTVTLFFPLFIGYVGKGGAKIVQNFAKTVNFLLIFYKISLFIKIFYLKGYIIEFFYYIFTYLCKIILYL